MNTINASDLFVSSWKDLSAENAWKIVYLMDSISEQVTNRVYTSYGYMVQAVLKVASRKKYRKLLATRSAEELVDIFNDPTQFYHTTFTHFYLPKIKAGRFPLVAPAEDLASITFNHFCYIDAAFSNIIMQQHRGEKDLQLHIDKFVATLYKPRKKPFDSQAVLHWAHKIRLPSYHSALIMKAYGQIRANIITRCPHLFPATEVGTNDPAYTGKMWQDIKFKLGESAGYADIEKAGNANLYEALDYLELKAKEAHESKQRA